VLQKVCIFPLSGTNWVSQILNDLIAIHQKKMQNNESSVNDEELGVPYLEVGDTGKYERMNKLPSPRFVVTYLRPENLPKSVFKNKAKILLLIRNPKDVATSFYHFTSGVSTLPSYDTWDDFFIAFMNQWCIYSSL
ncbi:PREDICTED: sulfotransferase 6B1-like, partial [Apaloderma vittatum]|uniref:sulfotransferase 6B1-like n=1 Tax=Apaloderma vittatum TaxID=57397 RepID=UPI0005215513